MVKYAAETVFNFAPAGNGHFDGFGNGHAQATRRSGIFFLHAPADFRRVTGTGDYRRAIGFHKTLAVGFLFETDTNHVDFASHFIHGAGD
ncbi:MAG: hypothetical protein BWY09_01046 [Candidatus Hydrogenedentes bacterium ADurb.Bin179]|nr:MAG: hypothetical protein BWY09_01046 [Candidatus Hydrogenedentes bacterium ADurb.Bin179]